MTWGHWLLLFAAIPAAGVLAAWLAEMFRERNYYRAKLEASEANESQLSAHALRMEREHKILAARCASLESHALELEATIFELNVKLIAARGASGVADAGA